MQTTRRTSMQPDEPANDGAYPWAEEDALDDIYTHGGIDPAQYLATMRDIYRMPPETDIPYEDDGDGPWNDQPF